MSSTTARKAQSTYPVFLCEPLSDDPGIWRFWCPFCKCWHNHSAGAGHVWAHCSNLHGSPFHEHGYILRRDPRFRRKGGVR
jgi:hypothetical protein